jgi:hypothetical protein
MRSLAILSLLSLPIMAGAAVPGQDPDWPCQQRLVRQVTAGTYWNGTLAAPTDAELNDPRVKQLVSDVAPRTVALEDAEPKIKAYLKSLKPGEHAALAATAFQAIVAATNDERATIIDRIEDLNRRQRDLAKIVGGVEDELSAIPETATGEDAERRAEIVQRRDYLRRSFEDAHRTVRYACEVPGQLDQRIGAFAKLMQAP